MASPDFDLIVIGAGSGGVRAARLAARYGASVAICEESRVGGTCVIRGCIPKKLLVYGAHFADDFADAAGYGWQVAPPAFDWAALVRAKDREIDRLNGVYLRILREHGVEVIEARARLLDAHTVEVGGRRLTGRYVLLATGAWPHLPPIPGIEHAITSNEAFDLKRLPPRIAIVGGGYIAVEFAGIFQGLGAEVTLVVRGDSILRGFDEDMRAALAQEMTRRGVRIRTDCAVRGIEKTDGRFDLRLAHGDAIEADTVMFATGRQPRTDGMGLAEAGVRLDDQGAVIVDDYSRTSAPDIYAVGDVTDRLKLTPVAIAEGAAVAETLFDGRPTRPDYVGVPTAVFSAPPLACVGLTEAEARARFAQVEVYLSRFTPLKHTLSGRDERTVVKLVVDAATGRVLGCHMVGMDAPEIVQGLAIALKCGATKAQFDATIGIHPSAAEEFVTLREPRPPHAARKTG